MVQHLPEPDPQDGELIELLHERAGQATVVVLENGRRCLVRDIAWGYDAGDRYAHITTNVSPGADGLPVDSFCTAEIRRVLGEDGSLLMEAGAGDRGRPAGGERSARSGQPSVVDPR